MTKDPQFLFRRGTQDASVWCVVHDHNEYLIPESVEGFVVVDIGVHVGAFACLCKERGASEVFGVEADEENLQVAMHNFSAASGGGLFQAFHAAAWRSDRRGVRVVLAGYTHGNTGNGCVVPWLPDKNEVPSIPFDDVLKAASDYGRRRIDLVKIDCEGSEWPILYTTRLLHLVDQVVGEYHLASIETFPEEQTVEGVTYSLEGLEKILLDAGFSVQIERPEVGTFAHFWAWRPSVLPWMRSKANGAVMA